MAGARAQSRRFTNMTTGTPFKYELPPFLLDASYHRGLLTLLRCQDHGPATKFIPIMLREMEAGRWDSIVIIADDDTVYPPQWIENFLDQFAQHPQLHGSALGMRGWCALPNNHWEWQLISKVRAPFSCGCAPFVAPVVCPFCLCAH